MPEPVPLPEPVPVSVPEPEPEPEPVPARRPRSSTAALPVFVPASVLVLRGGSAAGGATFDIVCPQLPVEREDQGSNNVKNGTSGERALARRRATSWRTTPPPFLKSRRRATFEQGRTPTLYWIAPIPGLCCGPRYAAIWRAQGCVLARFLRLEDPDSPGQNCP